MPVSSSAFHTRFEIDLILHFALNIRSQSFHLKCVKPDKSNLILLDEAEDAHPPDCSSPEVLPGIALILSWSARTRSSPTSSSSFGTPLTYNHKQSHSWRLRKETRTEKALTSNSISPSSIKQEDRIFTFLRANLQSFGTSSINRAFFRRTSAFIATAAALIFSVEATSDF